ncbi:MAG: iron ABC transporter permease [Micrococcaceae bacterium]
MKTKNLLIYLALLACLLLCSILSLTLGVQQTSFAQTFSALQSHNMSDATVAIVHSRISRTYLCLAIGAALGVAGQLMQVVTRNPLADPGILGVNAGAAAAVVVGFTFFNAHNGVIETLLALVGACLAAGLVYAVAQKVSSSNSSVTLVVVGAALSAACGSLTTLMLLSKQTSFDDYRAWQLGSVAGRDLSTLPLTLPLILLGLALSIYLASSLNILSLGDQVATALSHQTNRTKLLATLAAVVLAACATAVAGPIAFVGLIVPHFAKMLVGQDQRKILLASILIGPCLMLVADILGRVVHRPAEIPVGVMTALIGVPVFLLLISRNKRIS